MAVDYSSDPAGAYRSEYQRDPPPGSPGGPAFNADSLPQTLDGPSGPNPSDGSATLQNPKRQSARTAGDEFGLIVEEYNNQYGTTYPLHGDDFWMRPHWSDLKNEISRVANGRVNAYMCAAGKGHCPGKSFWQTITSIPVLGKIVSIVGEAASAPYNLAAGIASGERLDHVLVGQLKAQVKIIKDVAPYAQMVVSLVPGIGTGISAALGAGVALAEGKGITDIVKAAVAGAIPGGAVASQAFNQAVSLIHNSGLDKAALEKARAALPPAAQKAFDIGTAVASGENIQTALASGLANPTAQQMQALMTAGDQAITSTPGLSDAFSAVPAGEQAQGYRMAAGLLGQEGINEKAVAAFRAKLTPGMRQGFDAALQTQVPHLAWLQTVLDGGGNAPPPLLSATRSPPKMLSPTARYSPYPPNARVGTSGLGSLGYSPYGTLGVPRAHAHHGAPHERLTEAGRDFRPWHTPGWGVPFYPGERGAGPVVPRMGRSSGGGTQHVASGTRGARRLSRPAYGGPDA